MLGSTDSLQVPEGLEPSRRVSPFWLPKQNREHADRMEEGRLAQGDTWNNVPVMSSNKAEGTEKSREMGHSGERGIRTVLSPRRAAAEKAGFQATTRNNNEGIGTPSLGLQKILSASHSRPVSSPPPCVVPPTGNTSLQGQDKEKMGKVPSMQYSRRCPPLSC